MPPAVTGFLFRYSYWPMVRTTLLPGRVLFDDSVLWCVTISSYLGTVVNCPFGTMCTDACAGYFNRKGAPYPASV